MNQREATTLPVMAGLDPVTQGYVVRSMVNAGVMGLFEN